MPYIEHTLIAWGGSWVAHPTEEWACTLRTNLFIPPADPAHETLAADVAALVATFMKGPTVNSGVQTLWCKTNPIDQYGHYLSQVDSFTVEYPSPQTGTGSGALLPIQNTVAASLHTARARGVASRGRVFLPGVGVSEIGTGGILNGTAQTARATALKSLIDGINSITTGGGIGRVSVVSQGRAAGTGPGVSEPVTEVSVGRLVDTQRRRRGHLDEMPRMTATITP